MVEVHRLGTRHAIEEEASLWLAQIDSGLAPEARAGLIAWLAADPRHREVFLRMAALWDDMEVIRELSALFPLPPAPGRARADSRRGWGWAATAGAVALVMAAIGYVMLPHVPRPEYAPTAAVGIEPRGRANSQTRDVTRLATGIGTRRSERLSDGSVVQLNTATEIAIEFAPTERRVRLLAGEAQFDVFHDVNRPFIVLAGDRSIRAVGTAFNVRLAKDRIEVVVTEGRVAIASRQPLSSDRNRGEVQVSAGEVALLGASGPNVVRPDRADTDARLAWQRGMLVFKGEALATALTEVERYTTLRFEIDDPALRDLRIGGYYRIGDVDGLMQSLKDNFQLSVTRDGDRVVIHSAAQ